MTRRITAPLVPATLPPFVCPKLAEAWIPVITGLLQRGLYYDYWNPAYDGINRGKQGIADIIAAIQTAEGCDMGDGMKLRQRPDNPCILQQYQGDVWVDVFDYSACIERVNLPDLLVNYTQTWNDLTVINTTIENGGDITLIYPTLASSPVMNQRALLCALLTYTVALYCRLTAAAIRGELSEQMERDAQMLEVASTAVGLLDIIAAGGKVALAVSPPVAAVIVAVAGALTLLLRAVQSVAANAQAAIFEDVQRQRRVACEIFRVLVSNGWLMPAYGQLMTAIEQALFTGDDLVVANTIYAALQQPQAWYALLELAQSLVNTPLPVHCECDKWRVTFDFTGGQMHGWKAAPCFWANGRAAVFTGAGWTAPGAIGDQWEDALISRPLNAVLYRFSVSLSSGLLFPNSGLWFAADNVPRILPIRDVPGMYSYKPDNGRWLSWNLGNEGILVNPALTIGVTGDSVKGAFYNPISMYITHVTLYASGLCPFADAEPWDGETW